MGGTGSKFNHSRWFSKNHRRVLCLGLKSSGKSAITASLTSNFPRAAKPLPEIGCYKFKVAKYTIAFYDLKGDEQSKFFWRHHFEGSQGVIFVIDLSDMDSFENAKQVLKELMNDLLLKDLPFLVIGNKTDLSQRFNKETVMSMLDIQREKEWELILTCAISGEGVIDGMKWLLEKMNSVS